jgi:hypothetical protein
MRVIIAGGRNFNNYKKLALECGKILFPFKEQIEIVSGGASGADSLGEKFAKDFRYSVKRFPADWDKFGKGAGFIRNEQMAIYASLDNGVLIAFWDGKSKGTAGMIKIAKTYNLKVFVVSYP